MKILIASYHFFPEITPRAFRTFELAKELSRKGHEVTLLIPEYDHNYCELIEEYSFIIIPVKTGFFVNRNEKRKKVSFGSANIRKNIKTRKIFLPLKWLFRMIYVGENSFEYLFPLWKKLIGLKKEYDLLISVGLPISVHIGCALARSFKRNLCKTAIADYGDPFTGNFEHETSKFHTFIEKKVLKKFDFITVPNEQFKILFIRFKAPDQIRIIPHGFDFSQFKTAEHIKNEICKFGYAGLFYKNIRNQNLFFDFLLTVKTPFLFIIYTNTSIEHSMDHIRPYIEKLGKKLKIFDVVPQIECIYELSKCDFLVNFANKSYYHSPNSPSKLIDYALTKRPVFTFEEDSSYKETFTDFLNYNFEKDYQKMFDITKYDIRIVANQFLSLAEKL